MLNNFLKMSVLILLLNLFCVYGCTKNPDGSYTVDAKAFIISALSEKSTSSNIIAATSNSDNIQNQSNAIYNSKPSISQIERLVNDGLIAKEDYEKYAKQGIANIDIKSPQDHSLIYPGIYAVPWAKNATLRITYKRGNLYNVDMKDGDPHAAISIIITEQEKKKRYRNCRYEL